MIIAGTLRVLPKFPYGGTLFDNWILRQTRRGIARVRNPAFFYAQKRKEEETMKVRKRDFYEVLRTAHVVDEKDGPWCKGQMIEEGPDFRVWDNEGRIVVEDRRR